MKNIFYAQSGGVTSVINATASAVIQTARQHADKIGTVFAGYQGILGALNEELIDTRHEPDTLVKALKHTPGGAFGSCRYKLKDLETSKADYQRLIDVFSAHNIGYFLYNGGNDSQDTANKVSQMAQTMGYDLKCIGIPKTMDNDLPYTDNCPGFGSVAKYVATSILEASMDIKSMQQSTQVFILEVMGRHAGWVAAAAGLASERLKGVPHIILMPEVAFDAERFLEKINNCVKEHGFCTIVASEGTQYANGEFLSAQKTKDAFGHQQLGGTAATLAEMIKQQLGYKQHHAIADYLQRSARHIASETDLDQAYAVGQKAVELAVSGESGIMTTIERHNNNPYEWQVGSVPLSQVANVEKTLPDEFITEDGFHITQSARDYFLPLIQGEAFPPFKEGLPDYIELHNHRVSKKLAER